MARHDPTKDHFNGISTPVEMREEVAVFTTPPIDAETLFATVLRIDQRLCYCSDCDNARLIEENANN